MNFTQHAHARVRQRGIPYDVVNLVLELGTSRHRAGGAEEYVLPRREADRVIADLKKIIRAVDRATGKGVVISEDGAVITIYHLR